MCRSRAPKRLRASTSVARSVPPRPRGSCSKASRLRRRALVFAGCLDPWRACIVRECLMQFCVDSCCSFANLACLHRRRELLPKCSSVASPLPISLRCLSRSSNSAFFASKVLRYFCRKSRAFWLPARIAAPHYWNCTILTLFSFRNHDRLQFSRVRALGRSYLR